MVAAARCLYHATIYNSINHLRPLPSPRDPRPRGGHTREGHAAGILGMSCPSWQWHRIGNRWFPVRTLPVAPLPPSGASWSLPRAVSVLRHAACAETPRPLPRPCGDGPMQYLQIHTLSSCERLSFPRPALVSATARTLSRISKGRVGSRCHPHRKIYIFQDCVLCNMLCENHSDITVITCYITHNPVLGNIYYILGYINILILYNLLYRKNPVSCKIWYITC